MPNLKEIDRQISTLGAEIEALKAQGDYLTDYWLDSASNKEGKLYDRARWVEDGKRRCKSLGNPAVRAEWIQQIERGNLIQGETRKLERLHQGKAALVARISRLAG